MEFFKPKQRCGHANKATIIFSSGITSWMIKELEVENLSVSEYYQTKINNLDRDPFSAVYSDLYGRS
jgi:hypothetical protein